MPLSPAILPCFSGRQFRPALSASHAGPRMRSGRWAVRPAVTACVLALSSLAGWAQEAPEPDAPEPDSMQAQKPAQSEAPGSDFAQCLDGLRQTGGFARIDEATWQRYVVPLQPDMSVLPLLNRQPEFSLRPWDYLAQLVDAERVADGRAAYRRWQDVLQRIGAEYGVDPAMVVGVWGIESNFGQNVGGRPLVQSLATLSCYGRRQTYFRTEFANALRILQEGDIPASQLNGSWAGAFGQTQFMPSTFLRTAVDFDGDGRRDIVGSVPDALASTARFLQQAGWRTGEPWGYEVQLPPGFDTSGAGRRNRQDVGLWAAQGVTLPGGAPLPAVPDRAGLMLPAGPQGPAFLVGRNFDTLYRYNASENYALAIAHLSDLIAGRDRSVAFRTAWPTDDPGLSRADNRELQRLLLARGHAVGVADGLIGARTRDAIRAEQARLGMPVTGRAGQRLLAALRGGGARPVQDMSPAAPPAAVRPARPVPRAAGLGQTDF